jgi:hypothetical protein
MRSRATPGVVDLAAGSQVIAQDLSRRGAAHVGDDRDLPFREVVYPAWRSWSLVKSDRPGIF